MGCHFAPDTDENRIKDFERRKRERNPLLAPRPFPLKLICPDQPTIGGYNNLQKVLNAYSKAAYQAATDQSLSTEARWERYTSGTQSMLLEKSFAASGLGPDICVKRDRLIDELVAKGQTREVVQYYREQASLYETYFRHKLKCTITSSSINCPASGDLDLLSTAVIESQVYIRYSDFLARNDMSRDDHQRVKAKAFVASLEVQAAKFNEEFHRAYNARK